MRVSVAIPLYNEEQVLSELLRRVRAVLGEIPGGPHELVLVDDGSSDGTRALLTSAVAITPGLRVIRLSRNFGHQAAISAALDHATGDVVVVMDGDLQDPPEAIPRLLEAYRDGADVVYAVRASRKESWLLRLAYRLFYRVLRRVSRVRIPLDAGDFALLSARVVRELRALPERHRFRRGLRAWVGFEQRAVAIDRGERAAGVSKYSFTGLLRLGFDGLFAFSTWPIRAAMMVGAVASAGAGLFALYSIALRLFTGKVPAGFTAIVVVTIFLSGINLFFLGIIGEYVGRVYDEVKQRPHYVIDEVMEGAVEDG
jgi:glycosyltransferase involved in cell wall biosynthesis